MSPASTPIPIWGRGRQAAESYFLGLRKRTFHRKWSAESTGAGKSQTSECVSSGSLSHRIHTRLGSAMARPAALTMTKNNNKPGCRLPKARILLRSSVWPVSAHNKQFIKYFLNNIFFIWCLYMVSILYTKFTASSKSILYSQGLLTLPQRGEVRWPTSKGRTVQGLEPKVSDKQ